MGVTGTGREEVREVKPKDTPQSREFLEEKEHTSVLVNECENGGEWIEDCPTPTVSVLLQKGKIEKKVEAVLDSGSDVNIVNWEVALTFETTWKTLESVGEKVWSVTTANGSETKVKWCVDLVLGMGKVGLGEVRFYVVKEVPAEVVVGNTTMERWGVVIDW